MECAICYEAIKDDLTKMEEGILQESSLGELRAKTFPIRMIQCPTQKHDLCDSCMIRWMKDSLEQHKDVNCVICNQRIHSFMHYRREVLQQEREEAARQREAFEAVEVATAEIRLHQMIRGSLERNIREINGMMGKLCCWSGVGFGISFMILIFYPGDTTKLTYFMLVYIGVCSLIMMGLFFNRLFYISQLNEMNRIHPELRDSQVSLGNETLPI